VVLGSAESEHPITNCEIIFDEFQPMYVITIRQRNGPTDRQIAVAISEISYKQCYCLIEF